jgi:hypothetical protein
VLAGDRGLALDVADAERSYPRALELAPPGHPERADILVRWAEALRQRQRSTEARSALEEAVADFRGRVDTLRAATTLSLLGLVIHRQADRRGSELITESVAMLEAEPPGKELVDVYLAAFAERRGMEEFVVATSLTSLLLLIDLGSCDEAFELAETIAERLKSVESALDELEAMIAMADILALRGQIAARADSPKDRAARSRVGRTAVRGRRGAVVAFVRMASHDRDGPWRSSRRSTGPSRRGRSLTASPPSPGWFAPRSRWRTPSSRSASFGGSTRSIPCRRTAW